MKVPALAERIFHSAIDRVVVRRGPDFIVGADSPGGAYLERWYLTPWRRWQTDVRNRAEARPTRTNRLIAWLANKLPNLYLHRFLRDDDDRALHDHPSWAASLILHGAYIEHTIGAGGIHTWTQYDAGAFRVLPTRHAHRIELLREMVHNGDPIVRRTDPPAPCWTLFLMGPMVREWGFHCPHRGWVHWREFTAPGKPGDVGKGCDA